MCNVLLGGAIGDALGMPFETKLSNYQPLIDWDGKTFLPSEHHKLQAGQWTDDSQFSLAVAESLVENHGFDPDDITKRYVELFTSKTIRGYGKMLSLETELPTPSGFIKLIDLKEGDQLFDEKGNICIVTQLHPIDLQPESYRITFDDGTTVDACADHLWLTWDKKARTNYHNGRKKNNCPIVRSTKEIMNTLKISKKQESNHSIQNSDPVKYPIQKLPIEPYLLGLWLGDGSTDTGRIETSDIIVLTNILNKQVKVNYDDTKSKSRPYTIEKLTTKLSKIGLLGYKHIPEIYLQSSPEQRMALLQGLMDSDGTCSKIGQIEYCSSLPELAEHVLQLITSLGMKAKLHVNQSWLYDKQCKNRYRITLTTQQPIFRLDRKLKSIKKSNNQKTRNTHRYIIKIEKIASKPMRCITVDSSSHLFLITRSFIPTHNTTLMAISHLLSGKHWSESGIPGSYGNGTAMRAAPFGIYFRNDLQSLINICKIDSAITHVSEEAEAGSIAIALAAAYAVNNETDNLLWKLFKALPESKVRNSIFSLNSLIDSPYIKPAQALSIIGTKADVRQTVPAALYCFLKFDNYQEAVEIAIRAGGDTDTTAAIVGALFGAKLGIKAIDKSFYTVENFDKLVNLDSQLYNRSSESFFPKD